MNTFVLTHLLSLLQLLTQSTSSDDIRAEHNGKVKNVGNKPPYLTGSKPTHKESEHSATFFCERNLEFSVQLRKSFPSLLVLQLDVLCREIWKGDKSCIGASAPTDGTDTQCQGNRYLLLYLFWDCKWHLKILITLCFSWKNLQRQAQPHQTKASNS